MTGHLTREAAQTIIDGVVAAFSAQDVPTILDGFTSDAEVLFGPLDPMHGRDAIETFLRARFRRQTNYRLAKELRMVDGDMMAVAWQGWWDDATTGAAMRGKGVEVWTIRDGRIACWEAAFTPTPEGEDPASALGIL